MEPAVQKRRSSGQVLALVLPPPEPDPAALKSKRGWSFFLKLGLALLLVAGALVATGYVVYQQAQDKAVKKELLRARTLAGLDTPAAYGAALQILDKVALKRPKDARLAALVAEIRAFLWGRYGGDEKARLLAVSTLKRAKDLKASAERLAALEGYHLLFKGRYAKAARQAEAGLLMHKRSARLDYVLGVARYHLGDLTAAVATFKLAVAHDSGFLPARIALGRLQRQRGHWKLAEATIKQVLVESPEHLEARLERWLIAVALGKAKDDAEQQRLVRLAAPHPPLLALAKLAKARKALRDQRWERARTLLRQSALLAPDDPEIALQLVASQLLPGGDARKAWMDHERLADRSREYRSAASVFARAALAAGRPVEALRFLRKPVAATLPPEVVEQRSVAMVSAARELDQPEIADRACATVFKQKRPGRRSRAVCLVHMARARRGDELKERVKLLRGNHSKLGLGLLSYQQRKYPRAVRLLSAVVRHPGVTPCTLLVLAESLHKSERPAAALPFLRRAVELSSQAVRSRLELAWGLVHTRRTEEAKRLYSGLIRDQPRGARTLMDLGRLGLRLGLRKEVAQLAKTLTRRYPSSGHGPYLEGMQDLRAERRRKARAHLDAALLRDPSHVPSKLALARLAFWQGDVGGGRVLYDSAWRASRKNPDVLLELARGYFKHKYVTRARKAYVRATLQYRGTGSGYLASGVMSELAERLGSLKKYRRKAIARVLKWSLQLYWANPRSHLRNGLFQEARGYHVDARLSYQRAIRYGPEIAEGYYRLGAHLLAWKRDLEQAERALERFLEMEGPRGGRRVHNARKWLARIKARRKFFKRRK
jgi:tetratricopeptide (TPR) repeat protein